jgi:5-methylcytosine-specific restriction endonuclease McrA
MAFDCGFSGFEVDTAPHVQRELVVSAVLVQPTLVLNRHWRAVRVCTVRKALGLVFKGIARVILPETYECYDFRSWADLHVTADEPHIRTVSLQIRVPEVILLVACEHAAKPKVVFSRRNLFRRDKNTCQYCGRRFPAEQLSIDHVTPRAHGGKSTWGNCVVACVSCNVRKGNKLLGEAGMSLLKQPREPRWRPSFAVPVFKRRASWEHFISEAYWNVQLEE